MNTNVLPARISQTDLVNRAGSNLIPQRVEFTGNIFNLTSAFLNDPLAGIEEATNVVRSLFEVVERYEDFPGFTSDELAVALDIVLNTFADGVPQVVKTSPHENPSTRRVEMGFNLASKEMDYRVVPAGAMSLPGFRKLSAKLPAFIRVMDGNPHPQLYAQTIRMEQDRLDGVFGYIRDWAAANSIYLGQVIDTNFKFINMTKFKPENVAMTRQVRQAMNLLVRRPFMDFDRLNLMKQSPKTGLLLEGPPGGGKTMTAGVAESIVISNGGTVIHVDPALGVSGLMRANMIASRLLTAGHVVLIVFEDIEKLAFADRARVLEILDGAGEKQHRRITVGTTNFIEQIDRAMIRPGRFDAVLHCGLPDLDAFTQLINVLIEAEFQEDIDYERAFPYFEGYSYAMISNALSFVIRSAIASSEDQVKVSTEDLITGAEMVRGHHELLCEPVAQQPETLGEVLRATLADDFNRIVEKIEESDYDHTNYDAVYESAKNAADVVVEGRLDGASIDDDQIHTN